MENRTLSAACLGTCIREGGREVVSRRGSEWERGIRERERRSGCVTGGINRCRGTVCYGISAVPFCACQPYFRNMYLYSGSNFG